MGGLFTSIVEKNRILMLDIKEKMKYHFIEDGWINVYNYNDENIDIEISGIKSYLTEANKIEDIKENTKMGMTIYILIYCKTLSYFTI